ncbi:hypothetical protein [Enterococcus timonensis]|uniref:hypothetical protein n=1 Tax=Enterococcus timonensis TaxID=1852364 RepID=UPI0008D97730|nr:hypothetical protein [Enterococcus timonensis]
MQESLPAKKNISVSILFLLVLLQTALSILPGVLLYHQQDGENWQGAALLIFYLFVSNFSELTVRMQYKKQTRFPMVAYGIKLLICSVLIIFFASQTQWQFALILFGYELFQTLANSKQYFYLDSFYYTLLNPIFKGLVLNLLFLMKAPIFFDIHQITALLPALLASLTLTLFQQGQVSQRNRKSIFVIGFALSTLLSLVGIFYLHYSYDFFDLWRVVSFAVFLVIATFFTFRQNHFLKAEIALNLFYLVGLGLLYF